MKKNKYDIKKLDYTIQGGYRYDTQIWTSTDGGKTYFHCGLGKFCRTLEEAKAYKNEMEKLEAKSASVPERIVNILEKYMRKIAAF